MPTALLTRSLPLLGGLAVGAALHAQDVPASGQTQRDTVYVVRRDTVVVVRRDTLFVVERQPATAPASDPVPPGRVDDRPRRDPFDIPIEELTLDDIETMPYGRDRVRARREWLRYQRAMRRDKTYWPSGNYETSDVGYEPPPPVRTSEHAWAYHYYPTRLLDFDFPAATFGASYIRHGKWGVTALLGLLTDPAAAQSANDGGFGGDPDANRFGEARFGLRGIDAGAEVRWLLSPDFDREPLYLGIGMSFAVAPVTIESLVRNEAGTFSRVREAAAVGRRIEGTAVLGWDARFEKGFALDVALGFDVGGKGVFSNEPGALAGWDRWDSQTNAYNPYFIPVLRVGLGFGRW